MSSVLRSVKKSKKSRRLGEVAVVSREKYAEFDVDSKVEMIRALVPLGLMYVHEMLDDEVKELAGERYARKEASIGGRRYGSNPGSVGLAGQRVPIRVPRVRSTADREIPLRSYDALSNDGEVNDLLLKRVLFGISCRNYEAAAEAIRSLREGRCWEREGKDSFHERQTRSVDRANEGRSNQPVVTLSPQHLGQRDAHRT